MRGIAREGEKAERAYMVERDNESERESQRVSE